jgi:O-antigen/teichoic acid export membrane protein
MRISNSITTLVSVAFFGSILGKGLRYLLNVAIARGFGADALGLFAFGMVVMKSGALFSRLGLDNAIFKYVPQLSNNHNKRTGIIALCLVLPFIVGIATGSIIFGLFHLIPTTISQAREAVVPLFAFGIPFYAVMTVAISTTQAFNETKYGVYIRDIIQSVFALVLVVLVAAIGVQFRVAIIGYVLSFAVAVLISIWFIRKLGGLSQVLDAQVPAHEVISFSLPLMIVAVTQYVISWTDTLMLGFLTPARDLGAYFAAFQTAALLLIVLQAVNSVFPPLASELHDQDDWVTLGQIYTTITKWIFSLTLLGTIYIFVFDSVVLTIFDLSSPTAEISLVLLTVGQLVAASVGPAGFLLSMTGNERLETLNTTVVSLLNIGLNYVLILLYGIIGAAIATAISLILLNVFRVAEIWRLYDLVPFSRSLFRPLWGVAIATVIMVSLRWVGPETFFFAILSGIVGLIIFVVFIVAIGLDSDDLMLINSLQEL